MNLPSIEINPLFHHIEIGIGTWAWGDRFVWGYGQGYNDHDLEQAFQTSLEHGIRLFDTAEIYGKGKSEECLGQFAKGHRDHLIIASKFMPFPWKLSPGSLKNALQRSLERLGMESLDLYQMHHPSLPVMIETWMDQMAEAFQAGLIKAVGVSNYTPSQTRRAYDRLLQSGIRLASTQVEYHLLNRSIESNGLISLCDELGVKVIAYSPLAMGLLTGKYSENNPPTGLRGVRASRARLKEIQPLIHVLKEIGDSHNGKTPAQVAINWTICKNTIPIPGAKNAAQARENAESAGWKLTSDEVAELDKISSNLSTSD